MPHPGQHNLLTLLGSTTSQEERVKAKQANNKQKQKKKNRGVNRPLWWAKHQASKGKSLAFSGPPSSRQEPLTEQASGEEVGLEEGPTPPDKVLPPTPSQPLQEVVSTSSPEAAEALKARERSWADASEEVDP